MNDELKAKLAKIKPDQDIPDDDTRAVAEEKHFGEAKIAELKYEHAHKKQVNELGLIGKIFGSENEKPGNIAGFVLIVSFVLLFCIIFFKAADLKLISIVSSIITLVLGYLFGKSKS